MKKNVTVEASGAVRVGGRFRRETYPEKCKLGLLGTK